METQKLYENREGFCSLESFIIVLRCDLSKQTGSKVLAVFNESA